MPRPIWKGHISFGLVSVPVTLLSAQEHADLELHLLDSRDKSRVRYERISEKTGREVPWDSIVKGYEYTDGKYVLLSEQELKHAAPEFTRAVEIDSFVPLADIDPVYFDKPYFLEPAKAGAKGYALLRGAMIDAGRVAVARVVIRTRQYMAAVIPRGELLVLMLMRYAHELRSPKDIEVPPLKAAAVSTAERKSARLLVDAMSKPWKPEAFKDEFRAKLLKYIKKRAKESPDRPVNIPDDEDDAPPPPINFMELLQKSVATNATKGRKHAAKSAKAPAQRRKAG